MAFGKSYLTRCPQCRSAIAPDTRPIVMKIDSEAIVIERFENICPVCGCDLDEARKAYYDQEKTINWQDT